MVLRQNSGVLRFSRIMSFVPWAGPLLGIDGYGIAILSGPVGLAVVSSIGLLACLRCSRLKVVVAVNRVLFRFLMVHIRR